MFELCLITKDNKFNNIWKKYDFLMKHRFFLLNFNILSHKVNKAQENFKTIQCPISGLARPLCFPADIYRGWCKLNFGP